MDSAPKRAPTEREQFEAERAMTDPTTLQRQKRSEYVTCVIDRSNQERPLTWCRNLRSSTTFYFIDIDHAAFNGRAGGVLTVCPECRKAIFRALRNVRLTQSGTNK